MHRPGYTLLEMLVALAIFAIGSALVVANLRSANEREQLDQAAVDLTNALLHQQTRSIANTAPTECVCTASLPPCDCVPQWSGIIAHQSETFYTPIVLGNYATSIIEIESSQVNLPSNITLYRVRFQADSPLNDVSPHTLVGFMPPTGRVATFIFDGTPVAFSVFNNHPAYIYLRLTTRNLCRRVSVEVNGRITYEAATCP